MNELEIILGYIERGRNREKAKELLRRNRWQAEKEKLEKLLKLLRSYKPHEGGCPDFAEVVRFYYGQLPSDRREAFIGHLLLCSGLCIETLLSLRESERRAVMPSEGFLDELWNKGLISNGLLAHITGGGDRTVSRIRAERLRAYDFLLRYGTAVVALTAARTARGRMFRAGEESVQSVVKENDSFRVEVYPSPEVPGRLEVDVGLKPEVSRARYDGAEMLVFLQAGEAMLSGIGVMRDGVVSGLGLVGGRVRSRMFDDPERIRIELYIGEKKP
jgi:hypothetical protein